MTMRAVSRGGTDSIPGLQAELDAKADVANTPSVVATDGRVAQAANLNVPALYAVPTSGFYRVSVFLVVSQAATTSSVLPSCSITYTEEVTSQAVADLVTQTANTNLVGLHTSAVAVVQAQAGSNIGFTTGSYASVGATPMQYAIRVKVEFLD